MRFAKVVFVRYFPLTKAICRDLYFEELIQNQVQVEYLDISEIFHLNDGSADAFQFEGTVRIATYGQLESYLKKQDNESTLFISIMTFEWRVFKVFRLFTKYNISLGVFARGVFPTDTSDRRSKFVRLLKAISYVRIKQLATSRLTWWLKKIGYVKAYDYIFSAGFYGHWGLGIGSDIDLKQAEIIEVNTVDYDQFLVHRGEKSEVANDYIVFLDQYLPYHPDAAFLKIKTVQPEPYFKELNAYFDRLEQETGKQVIIAGHPKADRYKEFNPFNGREILINRSNDLVKNASLVLTHASTAICFPICYEKRIGLLMSDYLDEVLPQFTVVAKSIVTACDAIFISIDKTGPIDIPDVINSVKYEEFKYKYLTSVKSENTLSKYIFLDFIIGDHNGLKR